MSDNALLDRVLQRVLTLLPETSTVDWSKTMAAAWRVERGFGRMVAIDQGASSSDIQLDDLLHVDDQKASLVANTEQLLAGVPANNALLWGARGTGKSSLIHGLLATYASDGLRMVEVAKDDLAQLPAIVDGLADRPYKFILFCDDLSFEANEPSYKELKSALEGSIFKTAKNVLIYATSNRRHLVPEHMQDNQQASIVDGELHAGEAVEEKISLSDRFGLWLSFYPFKQDVYLDVVYHWVSRLGHEHGVEVDLSEPELRAQALRWALARGVRNGRTAQYFARSWVGAAALAQRT